MNSSRSYQLVAARRVLFAWPDQRRLQNQLPDNVITRDSTCTNFTPIFSFPFYPVYPPISRVFRAASESLSTQRFFEENFRNSRMSYSFLQQFSLYNFYLNLRNTSTNETWSVKTTKGKVIIAAKGSNELGMDEQIRITVEYGKRLGGGGEESISIRL